MDEPDWDLWRAFRAVMRGGSLSAAARTLRTTQPTVGRQIGALEQALGVVLFTRSTEGLRPTAKALALDGHAETMASAVANLVRSASGGADEATGTVRLAASEFMGAIVLPPMLARFRRKCPEIDIELSLSDRTEDLLRRDADLAVRNVAPTQAALVARRIGEMPVRFYAHRDYAAARGLPNALADLAGHTLVGRDAHARRLRPPLGADLRFGFSCDSDLGLMAALKAGFGIGYCQDGAALADPDLIPVLPALTLARIGIWLAMHEDLRATRRIRILFDHLVSELIAYVGRS